MCPDHENEIFVVALTKWANPPAEELQALAQMLGVAAYDLRLRVMGPLPVVLARGLAGDAARELLASLRGRGHGAVACELSSVMSSESMIEPRDFRLDKSAFVVLGPQACELPYDEIVALLPATHTVSESQSTTKTKKKFSISRAALSGGLVSSRKVSKEIRSHTEEREQVLYVFGRSASRRIILRETRLRYTGLGDLMCATRGENFTALATILKARATGAFIDNRLVKNPRKGGLAGVSGGVTRMVATRSNATENDLAAHLLVIAYIQNQI
jgi:hypothetical protein